jgi:translation initiation factor RLI1
MSIGVPQPRYSAEHKKQAAEEERPLFTFDLYRYPTKRRTTITGVLGDEEICGIETMLRRVMGTGKPKDHIERKP